MLRRPANPPPSKDEPRFLTIVHPFPLHANLRLLEDRMNLARWLACVVGDAAKLCKLQTMYYKPSGASHCIIEVARDYDGFDRLLGLHRWSEFLKTPEREELGKESRIYWCFYVSTQELTEQGWKPVDFKDEWFLGFNPRNRKTVYPYPKSVWCDLPNEDPTGLQLCRPIPLRTFDRTIDGTVPDFPPRIPGRNRRAIQPRSVVGSAAWVDGRVQGRAIGPAPNITSPASSTVPVDWARPINAANRSPTSWTAVTAGAMVRPPPPELLSATGVWASAATSGRTLVDIPPAEEMTAEQEAEVWRRVSFDWAEDVEEEERALAAAAVASASSHNAASSVPAEHHALRSPSSSSSSSWEVIPPEEPSWTCPPPADEDDSDEDAEEFGTVRSTTRAEPVLAADDHRPAHDRDNYECGRYNGGEGRDLLEGWQCPEHVGRCTAGVCLAAAERRRQVLAGRGGAGGRGRGRVRGIGQYVRPAIGRGVVRPVRRGMA